MEQYQANGLAEEQSETCINVSKYENHICMGPPSLRQAITFYQVSSVNTFLNLKPPHISLLFNLFT